MNKVKSINIDFRHILRSQTKFELATSKCTMRIYIYIYLRFYTLIIFFIEVSMLRQTRIRL